LYHDLVKLPWPVLVLALVLPTAGALVYFVAADPQSPLFQITYAVSKIVQFALPIVALLVLNPTRLRAIRFSIRGLWGGLAIGVIMFATICGFYVFVLRGTPALAGLADQVRAKVTGFGLHSPAGFVVLAVFLSILHSFLEEYYWRWFVHAGLRERLPQAAAIALSSAAFAAHHVVVLHVYFPDRLWTATLPFSLAVAVGGAVWAWWYDRTGSIAGPWAAHALADAALMAVGFDLLYL
jgi:membrane protease YdiL (CAAX protease family)